MSIIIIITGTKKKKTLILILIVLLIRAMKKRLMNTFLILYTLYLCLHCMYNNNYCYTPIIRMYFW